MVGFHAKRSKTGKTFVISRPQTKGRKKDTVRACALIFFDR
jgi:hypothetical protein